MIFQKTLTSLAISVVAIAASAQTDYTLQIGDYNQNGVIEIGDLTHILSNMDQLNRSPWLLTNDAGSLVVNGKVCSQYLYGDMDMDGDIDFDDVRALAQVALGMKDVPWLTRTFAPKQADYANFATFNTLHNTLPIII